VSPPSMPMSMSVQPNSFSSPPAMSVPVQPTSFASSPAAAQSSTSAMTMPLSGGIMSPETAVAFTPVMPYASTASTSVLGTAPTAASMESVCTEMTFYYAYGHTTWG